MFTEKKGSVDKFMIDAGCQFTYFCVCHYSPTLFPHIVVSHINYTEIFYTSPLGKKNRC